MWTVLRALGTIAICGLIVFHAVSWWRAVPAKCLQEPFEAERSAYITMGRWRSCPTFPAFGAAYRNFEAQSRDVLERLSKRDAACTAEVSKILNNVVALSRKDGFCEEAKRRRDYGIGVPGQPSVDEVLAAARAVVAPGEIVIGAWLDLSHPAGLVVIVSAGSEYRHFRAYYSAETSRKLADDELPLEMILRSNGKREWRTVGNGKGLGDHDHYRFVEENDGRLSVFSFGIGNSPEDDAEPYMRGSPVDLAKRS